MNWTILLLGAVIAFLPGAYLLRAGKPGVVRLYQAACLLLLLAWIFDVGAMLSPDLAPWPKYLFAMLAPGTLMMMGWNVQNDRKRVMGSTQAERDALATAAVLYGAGHHHAGEAGADASDAGTGDA